VWRGDLCFMATAFSWACYSVMLKRHQVDPVRATIATTVVALVILVPAYALAWALGWITSALPQASWSEMGFQAFFQGAISVVVSGISFSQMVRHYGPVRTSMITSVVPSTSAMCAVLILGEPLNAHLVGGLVCVTLGILAGVWAAKPAPAKAP
jgi:drug/metabolite transporter (DMT)-like permease